MKGSPDRAKTIQDIACLRTATFPMAWRPTQGGVSPLTAEHDSPVRHPRCRLRSIHANIEWKVEKVVAVDDCGVRSTR